MLKWILFLLLTSEVSAQQFYMADNGRFCNYAEGRLIARTERRPMLILIKQIPCPPCVVAKNVVQQLQREKLLRNCVLVEMMHTEPESKDLMVGGTTPQMFILDNGVKHRLLRYDRETILRAVGKIAVPVGP